MTIFQNGFEGHTDEQVVDTTNSASSGFAWSVKGNTAGGGELTADTVRAAHGTVSLRVDCATSSQNYFRKTVGSSTSLATRMYVYLTAAVSTAEVALPLMAHGVGSGNTLVMRITPTNLLKIVDSASTVLWTAAASFPLNQWVRLEMWSQPNATTAAAGTATAAYFVGDSTTPIETFSTTAANLGTANLTDFRVGKVNAGSYATTFWVDDVYANDAAAALPGPFAAAASASVRPNSVASNTGTWTAFGSVVDLSAALADELDTTGVQATGVAAPIVYNFPPVTAGTRHILLRLRVLETGATSTVRAQMLTAGSAVSPGVTFDITDTWADYQYDLNSAEMAVAAGASTFQVSVAANST